MRADGTPLANAVGLAQGPARCRPDGPRRFPGLVRQDRDEPRPGAVSRGGAAGRSPRPAADEVAAAEGLDGPAARREQVDRSIDRLVWYAGWADKLSQVLGTVNPVGASYFDFSIPEPTGVVGVVAPETSSLLGLVSRLAPVVVGGNTAVVLTSEGGRCRR